MDATDPATSDTHILQSHIQGCPLPQAIRHTRVLSPSQRGHQSSTPQDCTATCTLTVRLFHVLLTPIPGYFSRFRHRTCRISVYRFNTEAWSIYTPRFQTRLPTCPTLLVYMEVQCALLAVWHPRLPPSASLLPRLGRVDLPGCHRLWHHRSRWISVILPIAPVLSHAHLVDCTSLRLPVGS